jgi:hypothetical protein
MIKTVDRALAALLAMFISERMPDDRPTKASTAGALAADVSVVGPAARFIARSKSLNGAGLGQ